MQRPAILCLAALAFTGCTPEPPVSTYTPTSAPAVREFLDFYNQTDQTLLANAERARWAALIDLRPETTAGRIGAAQALGAFRGSQFVIESARQHLTEKEALSDLEFRQLDVILLRAAESPASILDVSRRRLELEARAELALDTVQPCLERQNDECTKPLSTVAARRILAESKNLEERRKVWKAVLAPGAGLRGTLAELRDLRNRVANELGYDSYFELQVAEYGMSVDEMLKLMDDTLDAVRPLYDHLHRYASGQYAVRYHAAKPPDLLPADWLGDPWGASWPGLVPTGIQSAEAQSPPWALEQAEQFAASLGLPRLSARFWSRSEFRPMAQSENRIRTARPATLHIDLEQEVRTVLDPAADDVFVAAHRQIANAHYAMAYSRPEIPPVLREASGRAMREGLAGFLAMAARRPGNLERLGLSKTKPLQERLLAEALEQDLVSTVFFAGVLANFEYSLYHERLPANQFNSKWWELTREYMRISPPENRPSDLCDPCLRPQILVQPARSYDRVVGLLIQYQINAYLARELLKQDPRQAEFARKDEIGGWLMQILAMGAARDWRALLRERTGEDISSRPLVEYFRPILEIEPRTRGKDEGEGSSAP